MDTRNPREEIRPIHVYYRLSKGQPLVHVGVQDRTGSAAITSVLLGISGRKPKVEDCRTEYWRRDGGYSDLDKPLEGA